MKTHRLLILLLLFPGFADARIGETEAQCIERYGPYEPLYEQKDGRLFMKAGFVITIHYFEGKADYVIYSKAEKDARGRSKEISETEIKGLLENNAGKKVWIAQHSSLLQKSWTTEDGILMADYRNNRKTRALIIISNKSLIQRQTDKDVEEKENLKGL